MVQGRRSGDVGGTSQRNDSRKRQHKDRQFPLQLKSILEPQTDLLERYWRARDTKSEGGGSEDGRMGKAAKDQARVRPASNFKLRTRSVCGNVHALLAESGRERHELTNRDRDKTPLLASLADQRTFLPFPRPAALNPPRSPAPARDTPVKTMRGPYVPSPYDWGSGDEERRAVDICG